MPSTRLSFPQGDDALVCVHVVDSDGEPVQNLNLFAEITFTIKRSQQDADADAVFQGALTGGKITILNPPEDGIFEVAIPTSASGSMLIGQPYFWTAKLTSDIGKVSTPVYGTIFAESPIQRWAWHS